MKHLGERAGIVADTRCIPYARRALAVSATTRMA